MDTRLRFYWNATLRFGTIFYFLMKQWEVTDLSPLESKIIYIVEIEFIQSKPGRILFYWVSRPQTEDIKWSLHVINVALIIGFRPSGPVPAQTVPVQPRTGQKRVELSWIVLSSVNSYCRAPSGTFLVSTAMREEGSWLVSQSFK